MDCHEPSKDQLLQQITTSLDDMSYKSIINKLSVDIDKRVVMRRAQPLSIDCDFISDYQSFSNSMDNDGKDKDNPTIKSITATSSDEELDQSDSGANQIVTNNFEALVNVTAIEPINMGGANTNKEADIICTHKGELPIQSDTGEMLYPTAYFCKEVDGTIISPTALTKQFSQKISGWLQHSSTDDNTGTITLLARDGQNFVCPTICLNDLWYHVIKPAKLPHKSTTPIIHKLGSAATYELWHQRTAHAGSSTLEILHKHVEGVPKLQGNVFYKCSLCMSAKLCTKQPIGKSKQKQFNDSHITDDINDDIYMPNAEAGQHFHLDFGFVCGSDFNYKTKQGSTITSIDGKNSYLSIIDRATRFM